MTTDIGQLPIISGRKCSRLHMRIPEAIIKLPSVVSFRRDVLQRKGVFLLSKSSLSESHLHNVQQLRQLAMDCEKDEHIYWFVREKQ